MTQTKCNIADLVEFHLRWLEFRSAALAISNSKALGCEDREIISWLVKMADRVSEADLIMSDKFSEREE